MTTEAGSPAGSAVVSSQPPAEGGGDAGKFCQTLAAVAANAAKIHAAGSDSPAADYDWAKIDAATLSTIAATGKDIETATDHVTAYVAKNCGFDLDNESPAN